MEKLNNIKSAEENRKTGSTVFLLLSVAIWSEYYLEKNRLFLFIEYDEITTWKQYAKITSEYRIEM